MKKMNIVSLFAVLAVTVSLLLGCNKSGSLPQNRIDLQESNQKSETLIRELDVSTQELQKAEAAH
ncbi:MAG: hypothetical protein NTU85_02795 [Candidatus Kaiserbacteria bacterium]|nr:hypothetical protein [Candidatus Kaiserbacteria bacterium]